MIGDSPSRSVAFIRELEQRAMASGIPGAELMENAARGATRLLLDQRPAGPVVVLVGKGNNGGDGLAVARLLHEAGLRASVELTVPPTLLTGDALLMFHRLAPFRLDINAVDDRLAERLHRAEWIVDALLGTGLHGPPREPFPFAIETINAADKKVLAIDLPSGLDADRGEPFSVCVAADLTATFLCRKLGFDNPRSRQWTGVVRVVDIGVPLDDVTSN